LEIAKLVASGMTNKAVAAARASAVRTVGTHLYNIYKKLELGGPGARARLAVMMRESAQED
jgi:DNA-binding NarL/FixJ family response regulator